MKNTANKIEEKAFTANEVGLMIERFDEKISTLAESMEIKFENVDRRFDAVDERLELVEIKIDRLQDDMVEVKFDLKRKVDAE